MCRESDSTDNVRGRTSTIPHFYTSAVTIDRYGDESRHSYPKTGVRRGVTSSRPNTGTTVCTSVTARSFGEETETTRSVLPNLGQTLLRLLYVNIRDSGSLGLLPYYLKQGITTSV